VFATGNRFSYRFHGHSVSFVNATGSASKRNRFSEDQGWFLFSRPSLGLVVLQQLGEMIIPISLNITATSRPRSVSHYAFMSSHFKPIVHRSGPLWVRLVPISSYYWRPRLKCTQGLLDEEYSLLQLRHGIRLSGRERGLQEKAGLFEFLRGIRQKSRRL